MKLIYFPILCFLCFSSDADNLPLQLTEQVADCLTGHITAESAQYQSGETQKYFLLLQKIQGPKLGMMSMKLSLNNLQMQISQQGLDKKQLAMNLIQINCPIADQSVAALPTE